MDLKKLRYFLAVLDEGSISAAASTVGVTQQAISRSLQILEEEVGVSLIERGRSGISPTTKGEELRSIAKPLISHFDQEIAKFQDEGKKSQPIKVGVSPGWLCGPGIAPIRQALSRIGHEKAHFSSGSGASFANDLSLGQIDFAAVAATTNIPLGLIFRPIGSLRFFITSRSEEVARRASKEAGFAAEQQFFGTTSMPEFEKFIYEKIIDLAHQKPNVYIRLSSLDLVQAALQISDDLFVFLSDNHENANKYWGRSCFPIEWLRTEVSYGLLSRRSPPVHLDWENFVERCSRICLAREIQSGRVSHSLNAG